MTYVKGRFSIEADELTRKYDAAITEMGAMRDEMDDLLGQIEDLEGQLEQAEARAAALETQLERING